jgi:hypothetical protein
MLSPAALQRLRSLHARASAGDPFALASVARIQSEADCGLPSAKIVIGALSRIDQERRAARIQVAARDLYERVERGEPRAILRFHSIRQAAAIGHVGAQDVLNILRNIHVQRRATQITGPGAPRTGTYPMPYQHRVGIEIPGQQGYLPLTPQAVMELLALAHRILAAAVPMTSPGELPMYAPAPNLTKPVTALGDVSQLRRAAWSAVPVTALSNVPQLRTRAYAL